jgi:hypothetical protein
MATFITTTRKILNPREIELSCKIRGFVVELLEYILVPLSQTIICVREFCKQLGDCHNLRTTKKKRQLYQKA